MEERVHRSASSGYTLIELLLVLAVLGVCLAIGSISLGRGLRAQQARGAAQSWQAAAAWAQVGVLWQGGAVRLRYAPGELSLSHDFALCGGSLGPSAPFVSATTNLARWSDGAVVTVGFSGALGSPDGGGSLFFDVSNGGYRVVVRPESGLTVRTPVGVAP
jgi:prepilin-type N-terminal cleavage/methylation domain-containing protein